MENYDETRPRSIDERLTDYLLDELDPAGCAEIEAALADDAGLRARCEELRATLAVFREAALPGGALGADRRSALRQAAAAAAASPAAGAQVPRDTLLATPPARSRIWGRATTLAGIAAALLLAVDYFGSDRLGLHDQLGPEVSEETNARPQSPAGAGGLDREAFAAGEPFAEFGVTLKDASMDAAIALGGTVLEYKLGQDVAGNAIPMDKLLPARALDTLSVLPSRSEAENLSVLHVAPAGQEPTRRSLPGTPGDSAAAGATGSPAEITRGFPHLAEQERRAGFVPAAPAAAPASAAPKGVADLQQQLRSRDVTRSGDGEAVLGVTLNFEQPDATTRTDTGVWGMESLDLDAGRFGFFGGLGDDDLTIGGGGSEPGWIVVDGYGRRHRGERVIHDYLHRRPAETPRDMFFRYYGDNAFVNSRSDAMSTFAADVDTASYPLVRNYLQQGFLPPKAAVRTEEFVNYFDSGLKAPDDGDFAIQLEYAPSGFGHGGNVGLLKVGLKAREVDRESRKPLNLVFVIDSSGSMGKQNRLELVKRSLELLVDQLRDDDHVGIVTFAGDAKLVLEPTPGRERWVIREAVRSLTHGGSTNAEAGLVLGYDLIERGFVEGGVNRIVLCSDGVANTGETDQQLILERVRAFSERQVDLTAIGVGMGNHNDVFLEQIADKGNGSCHYVDDFDEAKRVFVDRFTGTLQTVARDVKIQVEFDPSTVLRWRLLGYENRSLEHADFRNDAVDAGEVGAGHEVVALYEIEEIGGLAKADTRPAPLATVRLRWKPDGETEAVEMERALTLAERKGSFEASPAAFRVSAVAAQFSEVLRRSFWARGDSYRALEEQADRLRRERPGDATVRELAELIHKSARAIAALPPEGELALLVEEARRMRLLEAESELIEAKVDTGHALEELRKRNDELERRIRDLMLQDR
ncbi:MAG TPA: von Willebrand factor type A domain-containing protein [Planctomycetota bacterium]